MFIIDIHYTAPLEEVDQYIEGHTEYLKKYLDNSTFIVTGRKVPQEAFSLQMPVLRKKLKRSLPKTLSTSIKLPK